MVSELPSPYIIIDISVCGLFFFHPHIMFLDVEAKGNSELLELFGVYPVFTEKV
jgi:hypothetical protein